MKKSSIYVLLLLIQTSFLNLTYGQEKKINFDVDLNTKIGDIAPTMWGLFFEDINFAADGGLYGEKIKNFSFEFSNPIMGWKREEYNGAKGYSYAQNLSLEGANKKYLQLKRHNNEGVFGIRNTGFRGIGYKEGEQYKLTFKARLKEGNSHIIIQLIGNNNAIIGTATQKNITNTWGNYELVISSTGTAQNGKFKLLIEGAGVVDVDMISLFPTNTYKNRERGVRKDIAQLLEDINPGFLRFPGGCIVEGFDLENRYEWKKTVGSIEDRETKINRWNFEFAHRSTPDYFQSFGLGFFEYFQLSEDLGAEPLPILSCGLACQYNSGELVQMGDDLEPYINDALDLIEFANGSITSTWGKVRSDMGHPEPFNLKYIGVGNENWGPQYIERAKAFQKAIKAKYPEVKIISTSGPSSDGREFDYLWSELKKMDAEIIDEHYYKSPEWFRTNAGRYDMYDRNGPKVFAGEYAAHSTPEGETDRANNWNCALSEAAFMTGLERNADIVRMASYAPLLAHVDAWQWRPDLIWFDNLNVFGTPNYYIQKMFATNKGDFAIPITLENKNIIGQNNLYSSSVIDTKTNELIVKIANTDKGDRIIHLNLKGKYKLASKGTLIEMSSDNLLTLNTIDKPKNITPTEKQVNLNKKDLAVSVKGQSFTILKVKIK